MRLQENRAAEEQVALFQTTRDTILEQMIRVNNLDGRVGGVGGDAAVVLPVPAHLDVALIAPGRAPAVLDDPEVLAAVGSVADSQDSVVKLGRRAVRLVVDALLVELQRKI